MTRALALIEEETAHMREAAIFADLQLDAAPAVEPVSKIMPQGLDHLFAAQYQGQFDLGEAQSFEGYASLILHMGGAAAEGRFNAHGEANMNGVHNTLTLQPARQAVYWRSNAEVDFMHFYLPLSDLREQAAAQFGDGTIVDNLELSVRRDPSFVRDLQRFRQLAQDGTMNVLELSGWRQMIIGQVLRCFNPSSQRGDLKPVRALSPENAARIVDYMMAHIDEAITQEALAALLDLSPFHFNRAFKLATGAAPHQHLLSLRVAKAQDMLKDPSESLADIAYACGFSSQQHMTNTFTKHLSITPGRYRKSVLS